MRKESEEDREQKNKTIYELNVKRLKTEKGKQRESVESSSCSSGSRTTLPLSLAVTLLLRGPSGPPVATTMVTIPCGNKC